MRALLFAFSALWLGAAEPAMFRGDAAHSGVYPGPAPTLGTVAWTFATKGRVFGSPVVQDGTVYLGSGDRNLYALDAADGSLRWTFKTQGAVQSTPAVAGGRVVFSSADGHVYALDRATGKEAWRFATEGERRFTAPGIHGALPKTELMPDPYDVFLSSPVVAGGRVYVGSGDHHVYALDLETGKLAWKFRTGNVVHASPAVAEGTVYIGSWDRNLYALDAADGSLRWTFQTGDDRDIYNQVGIASSAAVAGGTVFFGCRDGQFYAVDARTGKERWRHDNQKGWVIASPAVIGGRVCFPTSDGQRFKVLEAETGKLVFSVVNKAVSFSSPALVGERAYFGTSDGWLHALDLRTGKVVAQFRTEGSKANADKYVDAQGRINYAALYSTQTLDGMMVGLDRMFSLGSVLSSPTVAGGTLYVGSADGRLYALR